MGQVDHDKIRQRDLLQSSINSDEKNILELNEKMLDRDFLERSTPENLKDMLLLRKDMLDQNNWRREQIRVLNEQI